MKKRVLTLLILLMMSLPLAVLAKVDLNQSKQGGIEHESETAWRLGDYGEAEAEAKHFVYQGTSRKSLKLEFDGQWEKYQEGTLAIDYKVNGGSAWELEVGPRFYVGKNGREMIIYLSEDAIQTITSLKRGDRLEIVIQNRRGESCSVEIPTWVLEEWLIVYHQNSR